MNNKIWICGKNIHNVQVDENLYVWFDPNIKTEHNDINHLNKFWSEYVCQYYVYVNSIKSDIVSFCHYNRIIKKDSIFIDKINNENAIQFYFLVGNKLIDNEKDHMHNVINFDCLPNKFIFFKNFYKSIILEMNQPMFMFIDLCTYLTNQNIIDAKKIYNIGSNKNYIFVTREIYSCKWDTFEILQRFLYGYFEFVTKKYSLFDIDSYKKFFLDYIIPHYRNMNPATYTFSKILYENINDFRQIFNEDTEYGFTVKCNVWRIFSYIIEILISIFILSYPNKFLTKSYTETMIMYK